MQVLPRMLDILSARFGFTTNSKGFKVLHDNVRIIQGDGVTPIEIDNIYASLAELGWSSDNVGFGMGGGLLQQVNRDDLKCAIKCSEVTMADGFKRPVYKSPVTDPGKRSMSGRLALYNDGTKIYTAEAGMRDVIEVTQTVYEDGFVLINDSLDVIRDRTLQTAPVGV